MNDTLAGVLWILGVGITLLAIAAWLDLRSKRRAERAVDEQLAAATGADELPTPDYVSEREAHRPATAQALSAEERSAIDEALAEGSGVRFAAGWPDARLANDGDRLALTHVQVLACEAVGSLREVLLPLERAAKAQTPLLLACGALDPEVADVLVVNGARGTLRATAVVLGPDDLGRLVELSGATLLSRTDLQAGYVPHSASGLLDHVVQDASSTTVVVAGVPEA